MQAAMHAARLVAAHSALLALLVEHQDEAPTKADGLTVSFLHDDEFQSMDVTYTLHGMPVGGECM